MAVPADRPQRRTNTKENQMASSKLKTSKAGSFAKGGSGHMFGKQSAGPQKSGTTGKVGFGGGKFAKGGSGHMFGKQSAGPRKAGVTGK
jgi:hypothetical protein